MKYEMIFGNKDLFDGAGTFTGLDVVTRSIASGNPMRMMVMRALICTLMTSTRRTAALCSLVIPACQ